MKRIGTALRKAFVFFARRRKTPENQHSAVFHPDQPHRRRRRLSDFRGQPVGCPAELPARLRAVPKLKYAGSKSIFTDFMSFLDAWTPMIFAALAVAVAAKAGLFNIGVSGQMLISGFIATVLVGYSALPAYLAKPIVLVIGLIVGAAAGSIIACSNTGSTSTRSSRPSCSITFSTTSSAFSFIINMSIRSPVSQSM
jgi:hypothetical protein